MLSGKFTWLTQPGAVAKPQFDRVVFENEHFVALPSVGALVDFWLLIVPKRPMLSISEITNSERNSLVEMRGNVQACLAGKIEGLELFEFEHGGRLGGIVSCGVDQAHLHMVALPFDLLAECETSDHNWRESRDASELSFESTAGEEYLFAQSCSRSIISNPSFKTSQWFRMIIARKLGLNAWDYKEVPNMERVWSMSKMLGEVA